MKKSHRNFLDLVALARVAIAMSRDICNAAVGAAEGDDVDSPLYDAVHNSYHELQHLLDELRSEFNTSD